MSTSERPAAPESGLDIPEYDSLLADPEIASLLGFTPVPRRNKADGWSPELQRMFIAWLAFYGSPTKACDELGKARSGIDKIYKAGDAEEFRAAWDAAVALAEQRRIAGIKARHGGAGAMRAPAMSRGNPRLQAGPLPGQVMNEHGEWEDADSVARRGEEARDSICNKLLRARRSYLATISDCPARRAAFEILTDLPIDWDKAQRLEAQADEPWNPANLRQPDMVLTAESGWLMGEAGYGPDKKAELLGHLNRWREEQGLEPVSFEEDGESTESSEQARSAT